MLTQVKPVCCVAAIIVIHCIDFIHAIVNFSSQTFSVPGTSVSVQIVFIDTIILTGVTNRYNKRAVPPGPMSVLEAEREWEWIESTLQQSTADWLIVAGHYPVWSAGSHGPTPDLVERLKPMLERYNVNL